MSRYGAELFDTARVVHQDVESAECVDCSLDDIAQHVDVGDVGGDRDGIAAPRAGSLRRRRRGRPWSCATSATSAPALANVSAIPLPMPLPAPVTRATFHRGGIVQ